MLADNIVHFSRVLRRAGLPVGPDRVLARSAAVGAVGLERRDDVHAALSAVMLDRHEQQTMFDAAFETFWRDPKLLEQLMHLMLPKMQGRGEKEPPRSNRLAEALAATPRAPPPPRARSSPTMRSTSTRSSPAPSVNASASRFRIDDHRRVRSGQAPRRTGAAAGRTRAQAPP